MATAVPGWAPSISTTTFMRVSVSFVVSEESPAYAGNVAATQCAYGSPLQEGTRCSRLNSYLLFAAQCAYFNPTFDSRG